MRDSVGGVTVGDEEDGRDPPTAATALRAALRQLRRDPMLVVPFGVAGVVIALADWLRQSDPLPVATPAWRSDTVSLQYSVFPRGTARTGRHVGALIDLNVAVLLGGVAIEVAVTVAAGVAGWLTIRRALGVDTGLASLGRYLGVFGGFATMFALVGEINVTLPSLPLLLSTIVVVTLVLVSLFLLPGYLVAGYGVTTALRESVREARGKRLQLFGLILLLGLASWGLALVPVAGGYLSTAIVAPMQAVTVAVLIRGNVDWK